MECSGVGLVMVAWSQAEYHGIVKDVRVRFKELKSLVKSDNIVTL